VIKWGLENETSVSHKADLLNTQKCGDSWWDLEGRKRRAFYLCFFVLLFFGFIHSLELYTVGIFYFSSTNVQNQKRIHCFEKSGFLDHFYYVMATYDHE
uniref:Uncharacterized protein n=1 Tax=Bos mutus grunniens TaxID=30521 RepID=A0A8B9YGQ5_BOSMU